MELVTVIVPIFNAAPYLRRCLDSVLQQTYQHLDILLVNDGSTDASAEICEVYKESDSRIRVVHKALGGSGVGATRNTALSLIRGDYVVFVDNDDWLEDNHIELLLRDLKETGSDVAVSNFTEFIEETATFAFHIKNEDDFQKVYSPKEWFTIQYDGRLMMSQCFTVPWGKLYKASLFDYIVYPEEEKVEDDYTTWKIYLLCDRIVYRNRATYYHRKRSSSVTKTVSDTFIFPLKSIEERIALLSMIGFDISNEIRAYRYRLNLHKDEFLASGQMLNYRNLIHKLTVLEKWHSAI